MKVRKVSRVSRKSVYGDSGKTMGLVIPVNGNGGGGGDYKKAGFSVNTIGRVLFPVTATRANPKKLSMGVKSVVADLKK